MARDRFRTCCGLDRLRPSSGQKHLPNEIHQQGNLSPQDGFAVLINGRASAGGCDRKPAARYCGEARRPHGKVLLRGLRGFGVRDRRRTRFECSRASRLRTCCVVAKTGELWVCSENQTKMLRKSRTNGTYSRSESQICSSVIINLEARRAFAHADHSKLVRPSSRASRRASWGDRGAVGVIALCGQE